MTPLTNAAIQAGYRARTNNPSMAGVQLGATFVCAVCGNARAQLVRKLMVKGYTRAGYKCADCAALSAARTADKNKASVTGREPSAGF